MACGLAVAASAGPEETSGEQHRPARFVLPKPEPDPCAEELWRQYQNEFYDRVNAVTFAAQLKAKGLEGNIDFKQPRMLDILGVTKKPPPKKVIVVGAGYGRDLIFLNENTLFEEVHAVEVAPANIDYLRGHFNFDAVSHQVRTAYRMGPMDVHFYQENIGVRGGCFARDLNAEVGLMMFGVMLELSQSEKYEMVRNMYEGMSHGGTLVVDLPYGQVITNPDMIKGEVGHLQRKDGDRIIGELRVHPITPNGHVDVRRIRQIMKFKDRFLHDPNADTLVYSTESNPPQKRQLLFFTRN